MVKYLFHLALYISISFIYAMEKNESNDSIDHSNRSKSTEILPYVSIAQCKLAEAILKQDHKEIKNIYENVNPDFHYYITHTRLTTNTIEQYQKDCPITKMYHEILNAIEVSYMKHASPYGWAIFTGNQAVVEQLFTRQSAPNHSADINNPCTVYRYTPLHIAAHFQPSLIKYLLDHGAQESLDASDNEGRTPLTLPCTPEISSKKISTFFQFLEPESQRNEAALNALIAAKVSLNSGQKTALHKAAFHGKQNLVELLLKNGAHVNEPDSDQQTAIFWATLNRQAPIAKSLLRQDAHIHQRSEKLSILDYIHEADENGNELTRLFVRYGAPTPGLSPPKFPIEKAFEPYLQKVSPIYKKYLTALLQKDFKKACSIIGKAKDKELIETDLFSCNPLHWAVIQGDISVVKKILKRAHCLPNKFDKALPILASKPITHVYQQSDDTLRTPAKWAEKLEKKDIVELLKSVEIT